MKNIISFFFIFVLSTVFVLRVSAEEIKSFDSQISINKNGTIMVNEKISYDFGDQERHGIYRDLPFVKTNKEGKKFRLDFKVLSVTDETGKSYRYTESTIDQKLRVKIGDPAKTVTGVNTYIISYKVVGAITYFSDHDELYWNCNGNDWNVRIATLTCQVTWPVAKIQGEVNSACYTGDRGSQASDCIWEFKDNRAVFKTNNPVSSYEGLTVIAGFSKGLVAVLEPKPYLTFWETWLGKLTALLLGLLAIFWYLVYPVKIIYKWFKYGRDPSAGSGQVPGQVRAWFDPPRLNVEVSHPKGVRPRFLTPAEVGTLGDETVDLKDISATIVDLARRGYMRIEERKKEDFFFVKLKGSDTSLLTFEKKLLSGLFGSGSEIRLKDEHLYEEMEKVKTALYEQVIADGLFPDNPQSIRTFYSVITTLALTTGNIFLAVSAFIFGRNMPRKTIFGVDAKNIAYSLKNFLTSQTRQLEFQAKNQDDLPAGRQVFEKLLPYAVAFGVEKIWAKRFENLDLKQPDWYQSYSGSRFNSIYLTNGLNSSFSSFSQAATPTTSSSGFSSGFSGGSSGGGGGGGGGGSW